MKAVSIFFISIFIASCSTPQERQPNAYDGLIEQINYAERGKDFLLIFRANEVEHAFDVSLVSLSTEELCVLGSGWPSPFPGFHFSNSGKYMGQIAGSPTTYAMTEKSVYPVGNFMGSTSCPVETGAEIDETCSIRIQPHGTVSEQLSYENFPGLKEAERRYRLQLVHDVDVWFCLGENQLLKHLKD